jgi:hypothetical protein
MDKRIQFKLTLEGPLSRLLTTKLALFSSQQHLGNNLLTKEVWIDQRHSIKLEMLMLA